jgi:hypothetical protein
MNFYPKINFILAFLNLQIKNHLPAELDQMSTVGTKLIIARSCWVENKMKNTKYLLLLTTLVLAANSVLCDDPPKPQLELTTTTSVVNDIPTSWKITDPKELLHYLGGNY